MREKNQIIIFVVNIPPLNVELEQWFSTGVPRHTSVPWNFLKCAAKF
jgi:hypothetical protein